MVQGDGHQRVRAGSPLIPGGAAGFPVMMGPPHLVGVVRRRGFEEVRGWLRCCSRRVASCTRRRRRFRQHQLPAAWRRSASVHGRLVGSPCGAPQRKRKVTAHEKPSSDLAMHL